MLKIVLLILLFTSSFAQNFEEKEIEFTNKFKLSGTLTVPKNATRRNPAVILISGSGQSDRDETIGKHKVFKTLAEYLSQLGIVVLRYDDRGGFKSEGKKTSNSTSYELSEDCQAAFKYLHKHYKNIGLIGHSEGGMIAAMLAARNKKIKFVVSMAGTAVSGKDVLISQNTDIYNIIVKDSLAVKNYVNEFLKPVLESILEPKDSVSILKKIDSLRINYRNIYPQAPLEFKNNTGTMVPKMMMMSLYNTWFKYFLKTDPVIFWKKVKCPVLALNGNLDTQVNCNQNLGALSSLNKSNIQTKILNQHNHLFQVAKTGSPSEYYLIPEDISAETLKIISEFILNCNLQKL